MISSVWLAEKGVNEMRFSWSISAQTVFYPQGIQNSQRKWIIERDIFSLIKSALKYVLNLFGLIANAWVELHYVWGV